MWDGGIGVGGVVVHVLTLVGSWGPVRGVVLGSARGGPNWRGVGPVELGHAVRAGNSFCRGGGGRVGAAELERN